jgi:hypothetical protein
MDLICKRVNKEGVQCTNNATTANGFCYLHNAISTKIILPKNSKKNDSVIQDCPICLCEIDCEDVGLICNHKFHAECLNNLQKAECPVCRGPLEFTKNTKVDVSKIKYKEQEENEIRKQRQILEDEEFCRQLQNEGNHHNNRNNRNNIPNLNNMFFDMMIVMEELERLQELEMMNIAIENSYRM